jgi:hypothetical protein
MEGPDMVWMWIFIAGVTLATVAIGVPLALITIHALVERAGSWTLERIHRRAGALSPRRRSGRRRERDIDEVVARDEITVR